MSEKVSFKNSNNGNITMAAVINVPEDFDATKTYPAVVVSHPGGGVKEQTAGLYAKNLAKGGFVTIAYDASYQGESTGEPRQLENPYIRTEDVSAVVDYLTTLPYVDADKIGAMGICAGGGYSVNAAINDHRIKSVGTVSAVNIGTMFRNGWTNDVKDADALPYLEAGSAARSSDAAAAAGIATMPLAPMKEEDAPNEELREAWEYYHTDRCEHLNAPGFATSRSLTQIITYDAYNKAEAFLTQPLLAVVGSEAGSKWMSDDYLERALSTDKAIHVVDGANHMSLYDKSEYVDEATTQFLPFFQRTLQ
ncbi:MAG: alpha/beta hydrolase [Thermomicrobiales bacterium]|nr:alpha/beta hydrolase [Thermomicrobiales bacterium]MCO5223137.1 alpha/beta hydrolase [Thermomicrobiales bacterium]